AQPWSLTGGSMAKLFLSYSRKDAAKAERFTSWLEREGHDVWRDEDDIGGGASFSAEIEKALNDCDAVLVLWSAESVKSAWVRDEAGYGRDAGKLIPFTLDGTEPPLGFRQFQAIGLAGWKRSGEPPNPERIRNAIGRVGGLAQAEPAAPAAQRPARTGLRKPLLAGGALALVAALVVALFLWQPWTSGRDVAIAVAPSLQSPNRAMAADYANVAAADMAAFLPRRFDRATVIAPAGAGAQTSGYRMEISTDPHGPGADAALTLSDRDGHTILWSQNWSVNDASAADLKAQVSEAASKAAFCLTEAVGGSRRLSQPALGLYLSGCTELGKTKLSNEEFVGIFDRITKLVPDFGPAWAYLALSRAWIAEGLEKGSPARAAAVQSARDAIAMARKLNPHSGMPYDAEYHLISKDRFRGLQILEQGARIDPQDGRIQMHLSAAYQAVGRMSDAVEAAQDGVQLEPGTPYTTSQYILALIYSGQFSKAKAAIAQARAKWPGDDAINVADFSYQFRYGDPQVALQLLPRVADSDAAMVPIQLVVAARVDPTPAKIDAAVAALEAQASKNEARQNEVLLALGTFGRVDQAYQLLEDPRFEPFIETNGLFRPDFASVRADPRFMAVAARLGLVRYWRQSGYWPDFCSSEKLKYDCKTEAAKYR
ncbi:MAG TPA: toll/interleukin-1 receptor domain-containing protein, partial [Sphingomicrobium sp.]